MTEFKKKVFDACVDVLNKKINDFEKELSELTSGIENDTKSSAGDKHETARAMAQLEQERIGKQLAELNQQKETLLQIDINNSIGQIIKGSLVKTDKGFLFLSIAIGKIIVDKEEVIVLSPLSPLGKLISGKKKNETVLLNGNTYKIELIN